MRLVEGHSQQLAAVIRPIVMNSILHYVAFRTLLPVRLTALHLNLSVYMPQKTSTWAVVVTKPSLTELVDIAVDLGLRALSLGSFRQPQPGYQALQNFLLRKPSRRPQEGLSLEDPGLAPLLLGRGLRLKTNTTTQKLYVIATVTCNAYDNNVDNYERVAGVMRMSNSGALHHFGVALQDIAGLRFRICALPYHELTKTPAQAPFSAPGLMTLRSSIPHNYAS